MTRTTKIILVSAAALGLIAVAVGTANAKSAPKRSNDSPIPEPEDLDAKDNETVVIPPGAEGMPDGSSTPIIVREEDTHPDAKETASQPLPPAPLLPPSELNEEMSREIAAEAAASGKTESQVIADTVKQVLPKEGIPPLAVAETSAEADPRGTVSLARVLLTRENLPGWKEANQEDVKEWQKAVGLKPDGKFGVASAARMAEEVGVLPLVRFWTPGKHWDVPSATKDFKAKISEVITELEKEGPDTTAQIVGLKEAIKREKAVSLQKNPAPQKTEAWVAQTVELASNAGAKQFLQTSKAAS